MGELVPYLDRSVPPELREYEVTVRLRLPDGRELDAGDPIELEDLAGDRAALLRLIASGRVRRR